LETNEATEPVINDPKAVLDALERAKEDAKRFREQAEELTNSLQEKDQKIADFNGKLLNEKVKQKLADAGIKDSSRIMKYLDVNALQLDETFDVVGFEEQIAKLKDDLPEVFDPKLRVGGQADTAIKASVSTQYSASEMQAMKILGKL
jgi:hypothetical protein